MKIRLLKAYQLYGKGHIWDAPELIALVLIARGIAEEIKEEVKTDKKKRNCK